MIQTNWEITSCSVKTAINPEEMYGLNFTNYIVVNEVNKFYQLTN